MFMWNTKELIFNNDNFIYTMLVWTNMFCTRKS